MTHSTKKRDRRAIGFVVLLTSGVIWAQGGPPPNRPEMPHPNPMNGAWWRTPEAERLGLNPDQLKKLDDLSQQHRLRRIDLDAALQKAQVMLEPLWQADSPDEGKILAAIDRVTQAQAELRKDEARMQLGVRQILSADLWHKLQEQVRPGPGNPQQGRNGPPPGPKGPPPQGQPGPPQQPQR